MSTTPESTQSARKGSGTGYQAAHQRVTAERGPARLYDCVGCFKQARGWTFCGRRSTTLWGMAGRERLPYSHDPNDYQPMCSTCIARVGNRHIRRPVRDDELETLPSVNRMDGVPRLPVRWDAEIEAWAA